MCPQQAMAQAHSLQSADSERLHMSILLREGGEEKRARGRERGRGVEGKRARGEGKEGDRGWEGGEGGDRFRETARADAGPTAC
jgi:hypothetical protein